MRPVELHRAGQGQARQPCRAPFRAGGRLPAGGDPDREFRSARALHPARGRHRQPRSEGERRAYAANHRIRNRRFDRRRIARAPPLGGPLQTQGGHPRRSA